MPDVVVAELTALLQNYLKSPWTRERTPKNLYKRLQNAREEQNSTAGIILEHGGFGAWVAYFLATANNVGHFKGRSAHVHAIEEFEKRDTNAKIAVATSVGGTPLHPSVKAALEDLGKQNSKRQLESPPNLERKKKKKGKLIISHCVLFLTL